MSTLLKSKTLAISIACPPDRVYQFVSNPENLPQWATAFCRSVRRVEGQWIIDSPAGPVRIEFVEPNAFGILDHRVWPAPGVEVLVPMRVIPNGAGSEVLFTLFQLPGMSDKRLAEDAGMIRSDLASLKRILE